MKESVNPARPALPSAKDTVRLPRPVKPATKDTVRIDRPSATTTPEGGATLEDFLKQQKPHVDPPKP